MESACSPKSELKAMQSWTRAICPLKRTREHLLQLQDDKFIILLLTAVILGRCLFVFFFHFILYGTSQIQVASSSIV